MEALIKRIQAHLVDSGYSNEAAVSLGIVLPVLRALDWDDTDPKQIVPEYSSGGRRVDFALFARAKRPAAFIEVKGVGRADEGDRQLFEYAFHEGIPFCVLTDGNEWSFYLPGGQGSYEERRLYRLQLSERSPAECVRVLGRYLARGRVLVGDALEDAMRDYRDNSARREASRNLPEAWRQLVNEPEDLLIELLSEQTESISGYRPTTNEVAKFLRSLLPGGIGFVRAERSAGHVDHAPATSQAGRSAAENKRPPANNKRVVDYVLFGQRRTARDASAALVEILSAIASQHQEKLPDIASAARGRSRNHIARSVEEIYPARPDLARAVEFTPGWLVGLNIANREKMRILRSCCEVVGLEFGIDLKIELPNA